MSAQLAANCRCVPERQAWLDNLPAVLAEATARWSLVTGPPFLHEHVTCSWVAPAVRADGRAAVLKLAMPHPEGAHEMGGLRFWNGDPTVRLLEADDRLGAMLLERCEPGESLRGQPEAKQDRVVAGLLKRLWRRSDPPDAAAAGLRQTFRPLADMLKSWARETLAQRQHWHDAGLVQDGLRLLRELAGPAPYDRLLAADLHAGNILRANREPWLIIDPKPFVGDIAFDPVQHLFNCGQRLQADPVGLVNRLADLTEVDAERLRLWTFARAAADPREDWRNPAWLNIAKALSRC